MSTENGSPGVEVRVESVEDEQLEGTPDTEREETPDTEREEITMPEDMRVELDPGEQTCGLRLRRKSASDRPRTPADLPLNLQVGYNVADGRADRGTPSPCQNRCIPSTRESTTGASTSLEEFRKQQSFEIHIEECDEEEIVIDSDGEVETDGELYGRPSNRPVTPMPVTDCGNVTYHEGPQPSDFLQVQSVYNDCLTDVSDAESEDNEDA